MNHIILLGDSIFDNARYVPGGPSVIEHLRRMLPGSWRADLLARDGSITSDVIRQIEQLPAEATHLIVSAGGNDALGSSLALHDPAQSVAEVLYRLADIHAQFRQDYRLMLEAVLRLSKPTAVCTIYDAIPGLDRLDVMGLCLFNDVILREAFKACVPVIDLRLICTEPTDYAATSPIEPPMSGGGKIARAISRLLVDYDAGLERSRLFA